MMNFLCCTLLVFVGLGTSKADEEPRVLDKGDGLVVTILKESKDCIKVAEPGDFLSVHYIGRLEDENGKEFDASRKNGREFKFQLGAGQVIGNLSTLILNANGS